VILAIVDPVLIAVSKSAPALIAGKSSVLKPPTQVFISLIRKIL